MPPSAHPKQEPASDESAEPESQEKRKTREHPPPAPPWWPRPHNGAFKPVSGQLSVVGKLLKALNLTAAAAVSAAHGALLWYLTSAQSRRFICHPERASIQQNRSGRRTSLPARHPSSPTAPADPFLESEGGIRAAVSFFKLVFAHHTSHPSPLRGCVEFS